MSIWRFIFDNDFSQRLDIENLREKQTHLQENSSVARRKLVRRIAQLEEELEETALVLRVLKELMLEKGLCTDAELAQKLSDLSETMAAERKTSPPGMIREKKFHLPTCAACGRPLQRNRKECMYCGHMDLGSA